MGNTNITRRPKVPTGLESIVKPEELVDIVEMTPLTLNDRRAYNLLLGNAWNDIQDRKKKHLLPRHEITKHIESNNQDIAASMRRLMAAIVVVNIKNNKNGKPAKRQIPLLGVTEVEAGGMIEYVFPPQLIDIVEKTQIFARIHTKVMFALSSKYSLALYECIQKRMNLKFVTEEIFELDEFRKLLGVPDGKLTTFGNLNKYAIKPAVKEVSFLSDCNVSADPIKTGRAVTHIKISWQKKEDVGAQIAAVEELERSSVGRKERMNGLAESGSNVTAFSQKTNSSLKNPSQHLTGEQIEQGRKIAREAGTGWDIYAVQSEFLSFIESKGQPENLAGAWIGFVKKKTQKAP